MLRKLILAVVGTTFGLVCGVRGELISDTFSITSSRTVGSELNGENTENPATGVTWSAYIETSSANAFTIQGNSANGYVKPPDNNNSDNYGFADVPFTISEGKSYEVEANVFPASGSLGIGFSDDEDTSTPAPFGVFLTITSAGAWNVLFGNASGTVSTAGWSASAPPLLQLIVNTNASTGQGTYTAIINGQTVASNAAYNVVTPGGPYADFDAAGIEQEGAAGADNDGLVDNFDAGDISSIPEPASAMLVAVAVGAALLRRRRQPV
jgi:hypothetical protein